MSSSKKLPQLVVFDLDYTLWPFWVDTHFIPPFRKEQNIVVDSKGSVVKLYPETIKVLETLKNLDVTMAVASRTSELEGATQLLQLFDLDKYFKYKEIYPGTKVNHFQKFQEYSGIEFKNMLFYDDENRNIKDLSKKKVTCILVRDGVNMIELKNGLAAYDKAH